MELGRGSIEKETVNPRLSMGENGKGIQAKGREWTKSDGQITRKRHRK